MVQVAVFLLFLAVLSWAQVQYFSPLQTKTEWGVFLSIMILVAGVGSGLLLDVSLPNPMAFLRGMIEPVGRSILH